MERDWLWEGFVAPGVLTMLSGHAFAGKSMLVSGLLRALDDGASFLGQSTRPASALWVSEDDRVLVGERARLFGLGRSASRVMPRHVSLGLSWDQLVAGAVERALQDGHELLVFDTFAGLARLRDEQENDSGAVRRSAVAGASAGGCGRLSGGVSAPYERLWKAARVAGV